MNCEQKYKKESLLNVENFHLISLLFHWNSDTFRLPPQNAVARPLWDFAYEKIGILIERFIFLLLLFYVIYVKHAKNTHWPSASDFAMQKILKDNYILRTIFLLRKSLHWPSTSVLRMAV